MEATLQLLPETWNELLDFLYGTPRAKMSTTLWAARQVLLFHGEVCNGGLYDKLANRQEEYPHAELLSSYLLVCGESLTEILREALVLLARPNPNADFPANRFAALCIAGDAVSRGQSREQTMESIREYDPCCPEKFRAAAYEAAVLELQHFVPWDELDQKYFNFDEVLCGQVASYAEAFKAEWMSSNLQ
jgi:hypothetical protein